jgi:hypothetical protein
MVASVLMPLLIWQALVLSQTVNLLLFTRCYRTGRPAWRPTVS